MSYLLDTNILSELRKGRRCDPGVASWYAEASATDLYISALTVGEIRRGITVIRRRDERQAEALEKWLRETIQAYSDRILPIDEAVAEQWGRFNVPNSLPVIDSLIAATASVHGLTLVTRNLKDIERTGVDCLNPFDAQRVKDPQVRRD